MAKLKQVLLSKRQIRDEMINAMLEGDKLPPDMRETVMQLGITATNEGNGSRIGTIVDLFADVIYQLQIDTKKRIENESKETNQPTDN